MHSYGNCCQYTDGIWLSTARSLWSFLLNSGLLDLVQNFSFMPMNKEVTTISGRYSVSLSFFFQRKSNGKLKNYLHEKAGMLSISADEESWKLSILVHGIANINRHWLEQTPLGFHRVLLASMQYSVTLITIDWNPRPRASSAFYLLKFFSLYKSVVKN